MKKIDTAKPFAFFLEILIVLFFFALSSVIFLTVYGKAMAIKTEDQARQQALVYAQNQIADPSSLESGQYSLNEDMTASGDVFTIYIQQEENGMGTLRVEWKDRELVCLSYYQEGEGQ